MGFSFKTVSNQNLASLVWLKSKPSLEWLLPLWAEPKLQSRGCLKPGARSRSDLRIIFFPLKFHFFLSSSLSYIPNIQTTAKTYYCFLPNVSTAWLFLVAHISLHLLSRCLAFLTSSCFSFSPFPAPSCASLFYIPSVHAKHCCYGRYPPYWPWYPSPAPWILSLVTLIPLHQIHTVFPSGCLELPCFCVFLLYWSPICSPAAKFYITILEFCCTNRWEILCLLLLWSSEQV